VSRDAARLVREINERVGLWQAESIRLAASAERMRQSGRHDPGLIEAINVLIEQVERQSCSLEMLLLGVPAEIAQHSRVQDTRRVLKMVGDRLRMTLRT
jgi:hypothetical protein